MTAPQDTLPGALEALVARGLTPTGALRIEATMADFVAHMAKLAKVLDTTIATNPDLRRLLGLPLRDEHHPPALSIDGAAYARRRKARGRRR